MSSFSDETSFVIESFNSCAYSSLSNCPNTESEINAPELVLKQHKIRMAYQLNPSTGRPTPPGLIQYHVQDRTITRQNIDEIKLTCNDYTEGGWVLENHTKNNLLRLTPNTKFGQKYRDKLKLLLVIKYEKDGYTHLKGALRNTETGEIALISSTNNLVQDEEPCTHKKLSPSFDSDYKIYVTKMIAPLLFWDELKNRILY